MAILLIEVGAFLLINNTHHNLGVLIMSIQCRIDPTLDLLLIRPAFRFKNSLDLYVVHDSALLLFS